MPPIKVKPSKHAKKRDFWGDAERGALFLELVEEKFGAAFGSRKTALAALGLQRRLFNMYITGERSIPDEVWTRLRKIRRNKTAVVISSFNDDDCDPLS